MNRLGHIIEILPASLAKLAACLCLAVISAISARAEFPASFSMRHITIDDGLGRNFIDDIYRDSRGFVWLSLGGGGLVRYDGHSMLTFSEASSSRRIPCDFVHNVAEDIHRRLWVATSNGLAAIDLNRMRPIELGCLSPSLADLAEKEITSVYADAGGNIWLCHSGIIRCLQFDAGGNLCGNGALDTKRPHDYIIFRQVGQKVWTSFNGKIYALSATPQEGLAAKISAEEQEAGIPPGAVVSQMLERSEDVWISTSEGLVRYNTASRRSKLYRSVENDESTLSQNFVTDLAIAPDNRLIASTLCGYNIYNALTDDFSRVAQEEGGLNSPFINCMLAEGQNLWIGTESGGVNLLTPKGIDCDFFPTGHPVNAVYTDPMGTVWVGCVEGGLYQLQSGNTVLAKVADASNSLPHNSVSAIAMDSRGHLWLGTWGGGVAMVSHDNPKERLMVIDVFDSHRRHNIGSIIYDYINDGIWIGANPGIFFYDCKSGRTISPIANSTEFAYGPLGAEIDCDGHLWMGCNKGLYDIDLLSRKGDAWNFRFLDKKLDAPEGGLNENISCVSLAPDGVLWIGSDSHGVYRRVVEDGRESFVNYPATSGLSHNAVKGLGFSDGNVWIATAKGLTSISKLDGSINTYFKANGLPEDSFYWNAASSSHDSGVYFGALGGLVAVKPENRRTATSLPVVFTSLSVDNCSDSEAYADADVSVAGRVRLHERNRSFTVTFSALDFSSGPANQYQYMLDGFDKDWIVLPEGRNDVSYTNLSPGHYSLKVKYGPYGMASVLPVDVSPYFYNTPWFILLLVLILSSLIWAAYRLRMRSLLRQKTELAIKIEERTREISMQKQRIEEQARQVQEFTVERLSFFTNLTHEFRTPITLVLGPLEHAMKLTDNPKAQDLLHMALRNAQYLMSLVNQLMDFRKIESGKMEIHRDKGDFRAFVEEVAQYFRLLLDNRGIKLVTYFHLSEGEISFDKEAMRKLLHNFLSNASKYTPDGGVISIYAAELRADEGRRMLYISVKDTGDGLDEADLEKVFDKFYQGKSPMKYPSPMGSSGLGLHLCKSIVEAYGGTLRAKNNHGAGCSFRMLLPLTDEPARAHRSS
ncbi:MAG: ATP-binding protein, partial [Clostridium sp.]|nr:ATP-binding protein [Clostridium sp.]